MKKDRNELVLMLLRKAVEEKCGRRVSTSKDFEKLAEVISESGSGYISASTLKRLWGYVKDTKKKHTSTLDVLAKYAGYSEGFAEFQTKIEIQSSVESGFDSKRVVDILTLEPGSKIEVKWLPDRRVRLRYLGDCLMKVEESENAKLKVGMTVRCAKIVDGEKLLVDVVEENSEQPLIYEAGKVNGVVWILIEQ